MKVVLVAAAEQQGASAETGEQAHSLGSSVILADELDAARALAHAVFTGEGVPELFLEPALVAAAVIRVIGL